MRHQHQKRTTPKSARFSMHALENGSCNRYKFTQRTTIALARVHARDVRRRRFIRSRTTPVSSSSVVFGVEP